MTVNISFMVYTHLGVYVCVYSVYVNSCMRVRLCALSVCVTREREREREKGKQEQEQEDKPISRKLVRNWIRKRKNCWVGTWEVWGRERKDEVEIGTSMNVRLSMELFC